VVKLLGLLFQNDLFWKTSRDPKLSESLKKMKLGGEKSFLSGRREGVSDLKKGSQTWEKYGKIWKKCRKIVLSELN